ncbi:MAG: histidinol-phosphate transaminase [Patescibacteria group bacterium]|nr:histidinol-phosphate transaminase [Patescibacteria group bacterium]
MRHNRKIKSFDYQTARHEFKNGLFFDANENHRQWVKIDWRRLKNLHLYPDDEGQELKSKLAAYHGSLGLKTENIYLGSGGIEIIRLIIKTFRQPGRQLTTFNPSYAFYDIAAGREKVVINKLNLRADFSINLRELQKNIAQTNILFICSPNNPTGNLLIDKTMLAEILNFYHGLLVVDEAYIDFAGEKKSLIKYIKQYDNLLVLRTFSKAWGLAGIRVGYAVGHEKIITALNQQRNPYNLSRLSQAIAIQALEQKNGLKRNLKENKILKEELLKELKKLGFSPQNTAANFIILKTNHADGLYRRLGHNGIVVRHLANDKKLPGIIRISVNSRANNRKLIATLRQFNAAKA